MSWNQGNNGSRGAERRKSEWPGQDIGDSSGDVAVQEQVLME